MGLLLGAMDLWVLGLCVFVSLELGAGLGSWVFGAKGSGLGAWGFGARAIEKANTRIERKNINANQILD